MSITFRVFADLHYLDEIPNWSEKRKLVEYAEPILDKLIDSTNSNKELKFIINLGDLIQATNDKTRDIKNLKYVLNKLKKLNIPIYHLLGNHELKAFDSNNEILNVFGYSRSSYSFDYEDYHFLIIGTDNNNEDLKYKTQYISKADLSWISKDLADNKEKKIIVLCHFGIIDDQEIMNNYWAYTENGENLMLRNRQELLDIFSNYNIIGMICGHQHWTKKLQYNNKYCYMLGSLTENIQSDGLPDGVFFDIVLDDDKMIIVEKHIEV